MLSNPTEIVGMTTGVEKIKPLGSVINDEPAFLLVGKLRRPHGLKGEMKLEVITDQPQVFRAEAKVYLGGDFEPMDIAQVRGHHPLLIISFHGVTSRDQVERLRNRGLYMKAEDLPPVSETDFNNSQLIGITVEDESGQILGRLAEILKTGANDVFIVKPEDGKELLLPAINSVILNLDIANKKIVVRPPEWEH